jgi:hypothetical protein
MHAPATSSVRDLRAAKPSLGHACMHLAEHGRRHNRVQRGRRRVACAGSAAGGAGGSCQEGVMGERAGVGVACGPRGRGRVESESKSSKKLILRDFYIFSLQQTFSPKKFSLFEFLVPKIPKTYEKIPATKQDLKREASFHAPTAQPRFRGSCFQ